MFILQLDQDNVILSIIPASDKTSEELKKIENDIIALGHKYAYVDNIPNYVSETLWKYNPNTNTYEFAYSINDTIQRLYSAMSDVIVYNFPHYKQLGDPIDNLGSREILKLHISDDEFDKIHKFIHNAFDYIIGKSDEKPKLDIDIDDNFLIYSIKQFIKSVLRPMLIVNMKYKINEYIDLLKSRNSDAYSALVDYEENIKNKFVNYVNSIKEKYDTIIL